MKRLLGLCVLFVVLFVSVPSYGNHYLIYNLSGKAAGVNGNEPASISWKGYLVMYLSDAPALLDANLIIYGKDSTKAKVYVELGYKATGATKLNLTPGVYVTMHNGMPVVSLTVDMWCDTVDFDFEGITVGKATETDIGAATGKKYVAKSAKGCLLAWGGMLLDPDDDIVGTSTVSSSLWLPATKYVNQNNWTQEEIIHTGRTVNGKHQASLIERLKGYSDATP
jgi:hypothetical protein